jgi:hypothetical protein
MQVQVAPTLNPAINKDGYSNEFSETIPITESDEQPELKRNFDILLLLSRTSLQVMYSSVSASI